MTIKGIFDTPISELWDTISPFVIGYLIFFAVCFVLVLSVIIVAFIKIRKSHRVFEKERKEFFKGRR